MRTLIVSDLHFGSGSRIDVLRRPELRAPLLEAVAEADRVVLLGDILELRHGPPHEAMAAARPFFEDLGARLRGGELVVTAGNHDHALIEPWLARRALEGHHGRLGLEVLVEPGAASPMLARIAEWVAPARVVAAYPGLWVRPDVYAMHGHYLDCHLTVPTLERLSVGAMSRVLRRPATAFAEVDDYEAVTTPVYAWRDAVARDARAGAALNGMLTVDVWRALAPEARQRAAQSGGSAALRRLRRRALVTAFPLAVAALNRAGLGPLRADISWAELHRAGLAAMAQVAARLGVRDGYLVFGHTHRAGPLTGEREQAWRPGGQSGAKLVNAGSWVYASAFLTPTAGESPYWPGTCVLVDDSGPPMLRRLLEDRTHAELRPSRA